MYISILGVQINPTSYTAVVKQVFDWTTTNESRYVCIANVHMLMEAHDSANYKTIVNSADMVTPDGMPLVWAMRLMGVSDQPRVYGPTLMLYILETAMREDIPIGFYGSSPAALAELIKWAGLRYHGLKITYSFSPPFREITPEEDQDMVERINRSGTRILFVGLGCPKQEIWMSEHRGQVQAVMLGVGAAFDFHAGIKAQAPEWIQKIGLEWLFRLAAEPRRLWKRYLYHNPRFIFLEIIDLISYRIKMRR